MSDEADKFLEHNGVVGMKWGKHKANRKRYVTNLKRGKAAVKKGDTVTKSQQAALDKHSGRVALGTSLALRTLVPTAAIAANYAYAQRSPSVATGQKSYSKMLGDGTLNMKFAKTKKGAFQTTSLKK